MVTSFTQAKCAFTTPLLPRSHFVTRNRNVVAISARRAKFITRVSPPFASASHGRDGPTLTPKQAVDKALNQLQCFSGTASEARQLSIDLIDSVTASAAKQLPERLDEATAALYSITPLYRALREAHFLRAFESARAPAATPLAQKAVSVQQLVTRAGLPLSALAPRQRTVLFWQLAGVGVVVGTVQVLNALALQQFARPVLLGMLLLYGADQVLVRGMLFETVYRTLVPSYSEKVLTHETGHFLAAYLLGLPVRGYVLSAAEAVRNGIGGQAGTLFSDDDLFTQLRRGRLNSSAIERYSIVAMAGIAAEAIEFGEAEGGQSDINGLLSLLGGLSPAWSVNEVRCQARWAVLEAVLLLRTNADAFTALRDAMRERRSVGACMMVIEDHFKGGEDESDGAVRGVEGGGAEDGAAHESALSAREDAIMEELQRIRQRLGE
ncbi:hypothetical protein BWQ96_01942 [Gracilariopsis chorda]|uniref:Uncharacterized protein n=1 Tax=Gracilariopsis chorda TaxID=448386 RepID=A0A2V3J1Q4_9FLOR|nr:hypothetical protein BWQ96_01942 [Gracilariopsis chorda]|eukprot:PXF48253.1 hypothetical protein BWQ96_01942 [Gracilariopsis chorda]